MPAPRALATTELVDNLSRGEPMDPVVPPPLNAEMWPSIGEAYVFVLPSYQWLLARYEAADNRLSTLVTWLSTLTLGMPVLGRALREDVSFRALPFRLAIALFAIAAAVGIVGRTTG